MTKNLHLQFRVYIKSEDGSPHQSHRIVSANHTFWNALVNPDKINTLQLKTQKEQKKVYNKQRLLTISPLRIHPMQEYFTGDKANTTKAKRSISKRCHTFNTQAKNYPNQSIIVNTNHQITSQIVKDIHAKMAIRNLRQRSTFLKNYNIREKHDGNKSIEIVANISKLKDDYLHKLNKFRYKCVHKPQESLIQELTKDQKFPVLAYNMQELKHIKAQSFIIVEYPTNKIILKYRSSVSLEIASLTKIMTFYVTYRIIKEYQVNIKSQSVVASKDVNQIAGTSAELIQGQIYTIQELLYGLMLPSGNDAANQLAFWGGGKINHASNPQKRKTYFVAQMNKQAKKLKMNKTSFMNPHGLSNNEAKSTAEDLSKLCSACMKIQLFRNIVSCPKYTHKSQNGTDKRQINWKNTNKLLQIDGFLGIKTGITVTAGPCLAAAYQFNNKIYISVLLKTVKMLDRFTETRKLLHWTLNKLYPNMSQSQLKMVKKLQISQERVDGQSSDEQLQIVYASKDRLQLQKLSSIINQLI